MNAAARTAGLSDAILGVAPKGIYAPATLQEASEILAQTHRDQAEVAFIGGGTELELGAAPRALRAVLRTQGLSRVLEYAPSDMVITAEAGVSLAQLQRVTGEHRQELALDPPSPDRSTVGGVIATQAFGPRRARYGSVRDLIIGATLVLEDGTIARGGGKVVKNVAGFDLPKLICGSLGTLGMIATATFRLHPLAESSQTVLVANQSSSALRALVGAMREAQLEPSSCVGLWQAKRWDVGVRFEGFAAGVKQQIDRLASLVAQKSTTCEQFDQSAAEQFWSRHDLVRTQGALRIKFTSLPTQLETLEAEWLDPLLRTLSEARVAWYASLGIGFVAGAPLDVASSARALAAFRSALVARGGSLILTAAPAALRNQIDVWGPVPPAFAVMRRLKERFDPKGRLNPGRFVGGL